MSQDKMENQYTAYYKNHTVKELKEVISQSNLYEDEARLAAYEALIKREQELSEPESAEYEKIRSSFILKQEVSLKEKKDQIIEEQEWYSPFAILGFTLFLAPFFGAILLSSNLRKANKKREAIYVLIVGGFFLLLAGGLLLSQKLTQIKSLAISIAAGLIFIEFFWKKYLGYQVAYKRKSIWKILGIFMGVIFVLTAIEIYLDPQILEKIIAAQSK